MTYSELMEEAVRLTHEIIRLGGRPPKVKLRSGNVAPLTLEDHQQTCEILEAALAKVKGS